MNFDSKRSIKALDYYLKTKLLRTDFIKKRYGLALGTYGFTLDNLKVLENEMMRESQERYDEAVNGVNPKPKVMIGDKILAVSESIIPSRGGNLTPEQKSEVSKNLRAYLTYSYNYASYDSLATDFSSIRDLPSKQEKADQTEELLDRFSTMDSVKGTFANVVEMIQDYSPRNLIKKSCDAIARTIHEIKVDPTLASRISESQFGGNLRKLRRELQEQYPLRFKRVSKAYEDPNKTKQNRFIRKLKKFGQKALPIILVAALAIGGAAKAGKAIVDDISNAREINRADYAAAMQYNPNASFYDISPETMQNLDEISDLIDTYQAQIPSVEEFSMLLGRMDSTTQTMIQEKVAAAYNRLPQSDPNVRLLRVETSTHSRRDLDGRMAYTDQPLIRIVTTDEHGWTYDFAQQKFDVTAQVRNEDLAGTRLARGSSRDNSMKPGNNLFQSMQYYSDVNDEFRALVASGADEYQLAEYIDSHIDTLRGAWDATKNYATIKFELDKNFRFLGIGDYYSMESYNPVPDQSQDNEER